MKINKTIASIVFLNGLKQAFFLMLAPFLPNQFDQKGIPKDAFTPLFVIFSLFFLITSLFAGKIQGKLGRPILIRCSLFMQFFAACCYIVLYYIDNVPLFLVIGFIGRMMQGIAVGFLQTASYSELLIQFPEIQEQLVSFLEFGCEFGSICGLLVSSFLSFELGFVGPFSFFAIIFLFFGIFQSKLINFVKTNQEKEAEQARKPSFSGIEPVANEIVKSFKNENRSRQNSLIDSQVHPFIRESTTVGIEGQRREGIQTFVKDSIQPRESNVGNTLKNYESIREETYQQVNQKADEKSKLLDVYLFFRQLLYLVKFDENKEKPNYDKIGYTHIMSTSRGLFAMLDVALCCQMFNFCDTTFSDYLKATYGYRPEIISLLYSVQSMAFLSMCFVAPKAAKRFNLVA